MKNQIKIINKPNQKNIIYSRAENKSLLTILRENNLHISAPCSGKGTCGKCKLRVLPLEEVTEEEKKFLSEEEIKEGFRLTCYYKPKTNISIALNEEVEDIKILSQGYMPKIDYLPSISKEYQSISNESFVLHNDKPFLIEKGNTSLDIYGIALDIGTTTITMGLINLLTGEEIGNISQINRQISFGLDVLSRISYCIENPESGLKELQASLVEQIDDMVEEVCEREKVDIKQVYEVVIAANTSLLHLLFAVSPISIGLSPYLPVFTKAQNMRAVDLGFKKLPAYSFIYSLASVSSFVGADIVAGAYVTNLETDKRKILFIDIGTNGEMILSKAGKMLSCSCAAGPALEGMNIQCGMRASSGAIEDLTISPTTIDLKVINDANPKGICGSGILAAIKELRKNNFLRPNGSLVKKDQLEPGDFRSSYLDDFNGKKAVYLSRKHNIVITQKDIRQVQLAKSAIASAIETLLKNEHMEENDLDLVYVAGQFGSHLPVESLIAVGILPEILGDRVKYIGNSSKIGAYIGLMNIDKRREMEKTAHKIKYIELSSIQGYEELFIRNTNFS